MTDDNFVERVHAYSKWLLGLVDSDRSGSPTTLLQAPAHSDGLLKTSRKVTHCSMVELNEGGQ
jgi:hypothetical protein